MRILAIIINIGWLGFFAIKMSKHGLPTDDILLFATLATLTLVINLIVFLVDNNESES